MSRLAGVGLPVDPWAGRRAGAPSPGGAEARVAAAACALAVVLGLVGGADAALARGLVGALVLSIFAVLAFQSRRLALTSVVVGLVLLGFVRRLLIPFAGWADNDPLLLVSPAAAVLLLVAARDRRPAPRTVLGSLALFQLLWAAVSVFNPNEPRPVLAAQGALFFVVPLLWFFVGRGLAPALHDHVLRAVVWAGVPVVLLGLWHTFVGLLSFELTWLGVADVPASLVFVRGFNIRPFSTLTSPQEYGLALAFVALLLWVRLLHRPARRAWALSAFAVTTITLFLQGSRGIFLSFAIALVVTTALWARSSAASLVGVSMVLVAAFLLSQGLDLTVSGQTPEEAERASVVEALFRHQVEGLLNPTSTTAALHLDLYLKGFREGLADPLGRGPSRYAFTADTGPRGEEEGSPESQLSITVAALGVPAALALLGIYVAGFVSAVRLYRASPGPRHLAWFALLLVSGDQALNGRLYFTSVVVAIVLGGIARERARLAPAPAEPSPVFAVGTARG